jgi:hypothetical protein
MAHQFHVAHSSNVMGAGGKQLRLHGNFQSTVPRECRAGRMPHLSKRL